MTSYEMLQAANRYRDANHEVFRGDRTEWARAYKRANDNFVKFLQKLQDGHSVEEAIELCR